jgi:hypothetical protein
MDEMLPPAGDACNNTTSTTTMYPDDDPFSTLNTYDGEVEESKRVSSWWVMGRKRESKIIDCGPGHCALIRKVQTVTQMQARVK